MQPASPVSSQDAQGYRHNDLAFSHTHVNTWLFESARSWNHVDAVNPQLQSTSSAVTSQSAQSTDNGEVRTRRRMNTLERQRYKEVRKAGACDDCRKNKRKCTHVAVDGSSGDTGRNAIHGTSSPRSASSIKLDNSINRQRLEDHHNDTSTSSIVDRVNKWDNLAQRSRIVSIYPDEFPSVQQHHVSFQSGQSDKAYSVQNDARFEMLDGFVAQRRTFRSLNLEEICWLNDRSYEAQLRECEQRMQRDSRRYDEQYKGAFGDEQKGTSNEALPRISSHMIPK